MEENQRYKNWLITINNPNATDTEQLEHICLQADKWVYQYERGEEAVAAEEHIHCFLHFSIPKRVQAIKRALPRAHIDAVRNDPTDVIKYVTKLDTRTRDPVSNFDFKDRLQVPKQGRRNDIIKIREKIKGGASLKSIAEDDESIEVLQRNFGFWRWLQFQYKLDNSRRIRDLQVNYWWGTSGAGKTYAALSLFGDDGANAQNVFIAQKDNSLWWDGYEGQKAVIFDDWDDTWTTLSRIKRILDVYPYNLEIKGTFFPAMFTCVIITSNMNLYDAYPRCRDEDRQALFRRVHNIIKVDKKWEEYGQESPFSKLKWDGNKIVPLEIERENEKMQVDKPTLNALATWHEVAYNTKSNLLPKTSDSYISEPNSNINLDANDQEDANDYEKDFV